ncbi:hypothetical protein BDN72DRAFT_782188 [Pluteus cervinus]|uniref:Uncharacterized protein n=1 Tax=Pluteus cervinus TaxID=181527 RepID=A0ACD2ZY31_9AGAR|nr:hypothetical protein BDN72DRAFT_782188 [Pluteus cervinus]
MQDTVEQLGRELRDVREDNRRQTTILQDHIQVLENTIAALRQDRVRLRKRSKRIENALNLLKDHVARAQRDRTPVLFRLMHKGIYTAQARGLARLLVSSGVAEKRVGAALKEIGNRLGVPVDRLMSKRTVGRTSVEAGVAGDIQLAYDMVSTDKLSFSSDATSHKHIEYESRAIALQVVDYENPDVPRQWKLRTLGVGSMVDHTSETQARTLKERLQEIAVMFNQSPFAKRENLEFRPEHFAYRLLGTSGDHAADQKCVHEMLKIWRMEIILQRMGEEALFMLNKQQLVETLIPLKLRKIQDAGGLEAWQAKSDQEKELMDIEIIKTVGKHIYDNLPAADQKKLTVFIRTGCCMHKDLNCVRSGDKAMQRMWLTLGKEAPILLPNKDNNHILEDVSQSKHQTAPLKKHAQEVSKRGGSHITLLGALICRNKNTKKGQQDTYSWYMETVVGQHIPYPDVSNTRYGSHGEAAATIIAYLKAFIQFVDNFIRNSKEHPGQTNIEKNFTAGLKDIPTLTELCVLALYYIAVSRPFMQFVRHHDNILELGPFFQKKTSFLGKIMENPKIWTGSIAAESDAFLDGRGQDKWSLKIWDAVKGLAPLLPDLDVAITWFVDGAREAFVERFSDEFKEGGDIDRLTATERKALYFSSTNDMNEGTLGTLRQERRKKPSETLHKFNARFIPSHNATEQFMEQKLMTEEDQTYLRSAARAIDTSHLEKRRKEEQMRADEKRVADNREKEAQRQEKERKRLAVIAETSKNLIFDDSTIEALSNKELNHQLDFHRQTEKAYMIEDETARVPLKSHMKLKRERVEELKKAVQRYFQHQNEDGTGPVIVDDDGDVGMADLEDESDSNDEME